MKKLFNLLAGRKSPEGPPEELNVEQWVKDLDAKSRSGQPTTGIGDFKIIGMDLLEMHTGDPDFDRRLREAQLKIAVMSEAEQTALIQEIFVGDDKKRYGKVYAEKIFKTLSGDNKNMMIRYVAERLKTWEEEENRKARTEMWLAARR